MEKLLGELNSLCQKLGEAYAQQVEELDSLRSQHIAPDEKEQRLQSRPLIDTSKGKGQTDLGAEEKESGEAYDELDKESSSAGSVIGAAEEKEQCIESMLLMNASKAEEQTDTEAKALRFQEMLPPGTIGFPESVEVHDFAAGKSASFLDNEGAMEDEIHYSHAVTIGSQVYGLRKSWVKSEKELARLNKVERASVTESAERSAVMRRTVQKQFSYSEDARKQCDSIVRNPVSSLAKRNWDLLGCFLLAYDVFAIPLGAFNLTSHPLLVFLEICGLIYWTSDIGMTMTTGYYANDDDDHPVMDFSAIVRHYVFSKLFPFDLTLVIIDWTITIISLYTIDTDASNLSAVGLARLVRAGRVLRLVKLMRLSKFFGWKDNLRRWFAFKIDRELALLMLDLGKILGVACIMFHYMTCMYYSLGQVNGSWISRTKDELTEKSLFRKYVITGELMSRRANTVTRSADRDSLTDPELAFDGLTWVVSTGFITWLTSTATSRMLEVAQRHRERNDKLHYIRSHYLVKHQIDPRVRLQLLKFMDKGYADYREAQQRHNNEAELLEALPVQLAKDFRREAWNPVLNDHSLFRTFDSNQIEDICLTAVSEIFCRKREIVFKQNGICSRMLFVFEGRYAYGMNSTIGQGGNTSFLFDSSDIILSKGSWLSEPVLWTTSWQHRGTLLAISSGFFCAVTPDALELVLKHHERTLHDVVRYAAAFVKYLNIETASRPQFLSDVSDTLMQRALNEVKQHLEESEDRDLVW